MLSKIVLLLAVTLSAHAGPLSEEDRGRFQTRLANVSDRFVGLTDEQLNLFAEILGGIEVNRDVIAFASGYGGGRENLTEYLRQLRDWRVSVQRGRTDDVLQAWFKLPGFAEAGRLYRDLVARGYVVTLTNDPLRRAGKPIDGHVFGSDIRVRVGLTDEPPALILLEELLHAADIRIYEAHKSTVRQWLRLVIAENKTPGIDRVSQAERYHWGYLHGLEKLAKTAVNEAEVDEALQFLFEQSAYQRKLAAYRALVKHDPRYRQEMWDVIADSADPFETINLVLTETRFHDLPEGLTKRIGTGGLVEIAGISDDAGVPGLGLTSRHQPELPWSSLSSFLAIVPAALRGVDVYRISVYDEYQMRRAVGGFGPNEIEELARYIVNPRLAALPYKAEEELGRRFGRDASTQVYHQFLFITAVLVNYDVQHGTHYTESAAFPMIELLHRDKSMRDYDALIGQVVRRFRKPGATPEMAAGFIRSLVKSRAASAVLHDPNGLRDLLEILKLAGKLVPYETLDAILTARYRHFIGAGTRNREGSSFLDFSMAQDTVRAGVEIMTALNHELGIRKYETLLAEADARIERALQKARNERQARAPQPADYDKSKLPATAATLIVAAEKRRKALEQRAPESFDKRKFTDVKGFFQFCADHLRGQSGLR